jgi:hypothetical protein
MKACHRLGTHCRFYYLNKYFQQKLYSSIQVMYQKVHIGYKRGWHVRQ